MLKLAVKANRNQVNNIRLTSGALPVRNPRTGIYQIFQVQMDGRDLITISLNTWPRLSNTN